MTVNLTPTPQIEMRALNELIAAKLPRLQQHFAAIDLDISMLATDWILCLYAASLPSEVGTRRWCFLHARLCD